jgi:uncharacterized Zn-finger protein
MSQTRSAQKASSNDYQSLSQTMTVSISRADLPLFCPGKESSLWCAHPKVYLPIEETDSGEARCPYCGTVYRLID